MPGLWGHSAQTTACFGVTSAVPVGVGQPGKGLRKPTWEAFQTKECDFLQGREGEGLKYPPPNSLAPSAQSLSWVHLVVWQPWVYFKICCPGRETKEAGVGPGETSEDGGTHLVKNSPPHGYFY